MPRHTPVSEMIGAAILFAFFQVVGAFPALAACDAMTDIGAYYAPDDAYAYRFDDEEAAKIAGLISDLFRWPARAITTVWLGFDQDDGTSAWFFYGPDGCAIDRSDGWAPTDVVSLLDALGIHPPIGQNYHQLPGMPLSRPGFKA